MDKPSFKVRARALNQLGEQLIKNESIALLELIKNAYDADASKCDVMMVKPDSMEHGEIIIIDDGEGMDADILKNVWLEIGTKYKEDLRADEKTARTKKYHRLRLGEKGIGRFGVHRLGRKIEIITKKSNSKECVLKLNWDKIETSHYIEDFPCELIERDPEEFKDGRTGTIININKLRVPWSRALARTCARTITSLNSPFKDSSSFRVSFEIDDSNWLTGILTFEDIEQYKLFSFDITMEGNEITDFMYEFKPWESMNKLSHRKLTIDDPEVKSLTKMVYKSGSEYEDVNLGKYQIGMVRFTGIIFDMDTRILELGVNDRSGLKKYLKENGGVRVFRDNMRVLDYGEPGNDWLDLSGRRVNMPTKRISNNIVLGAVYLDREHSLDLKEKANREGFIENDAFFELFRAVRFAIDRIESFRKTDKDLLRKHYGPQETAQPVVSSISELKDIVEKKVSDEPTKQTITNYLDRVEAEYEEITESLMKSAGAGLNLVIVIHQMEKILKDVEAMLKDKVPVEVLEDRVKELASLIEGYSILVRNSEKKERNLKGIIEQGIFNVEFRLKLHKVELDYKFRDRIDGLDAICSTNHVLNCLMNLFDNAIWWLDYGKTKNASIFLDISSAYPKHVSIVVADNGPGFTKPTSEIVKPFVSDKPGGMGIGLHLTDQIMKSLGGKLLFPAMEIFDIPEKYGKGAIIALAFKKDGGLK
jgi:signal transduction histidine kinase